MMNLEDLEIERLKEILRTKDFRNINLPFQTVTVPGDKDEDYEASIAELINKIIKEKEVSQDEEMRS